MDVEVNILVFAIAFLWKNRNFQKSIDIKTHFYSVLAFTLQAVFPLALFETNKDMCGVTSSITPVNP